MRRSDACSNFELAFGHREWARWPGKQLDDDRVGERSNVQHPQADQTSPTMEIVNLLRNQPQSFAAGMGLEAARRIWQPKVTKLTPGSLFSKGRIKKPSSCCGPWLKNKTQKARGKSNCQHAKCSQTCSWR